MNCFGGIFDWDNAILRLDELDAITSDPSLWEKPESAQTLMRERNSLEKKLADLKAFSTQLDDIILLIEVIGFFEDVIDLPTTRIEAPSEIAWPGVESLFWSFTSSSIILIPGVT